MRTTFLVSVMIAQETTTEVVTATTVAATTVAQAVTTATLVTVRHAKNAEMTTLHATKIMVANHKNLNY